MSYIIRDHIYFRGLTLQTAKEAEEYVQSQHTDLTHLDLAEAPNIDEKMTSRWPDFDSLLVALPQGEYWVAKITNPDECKMAEPEQVYICLVKGSRGSPSYISRRRDDAKLYAVGRAPLH